MVDRATMVWALALSCVATLGCAAVREAQAAADLSGPVTGSLQGALLKLSLPTATLGEMRVEHDTITGVPVAGMPVTLRRAR